MNWLGWIGLNSCFSSGWVLSGFGSKNIAMCSTYDMVGSFGVLGQKLLVCARPTVWLGWVGLTRVFFFGSGPCGFWVKKCWHVLDPWHGWVGLGRVNSHFFVGSVLLVFGFVLDPLGWVGLTRIFSSGRVLSDFGSKHVGTCLTHDMVGLGRVTAFYSSGRSFWILGQKCWSVLDPWHRWVGLGRVGLTIVFSSGWILLVLGEKCWPVLDPRRVWVGSFRVQGQKLLARAWPMTFGLSWVNPLFSSGWVLSGFGSKKCWHVLNPWHD
jgi:hypothetical protein